MIKKENLMRKLNCINLKNSRHLKYYVIILHHKQNITAKEIILTFLSNYPLIFSALLFLLPLSLDHLWYLVLDQVLTLLTVPSAISLRSSPNHILHRWSSLIASSAVYCWHFGEELVWYKGDTAHCPFMNSHRRYFLQVSVPGRAVPLLAHW